MTELNKKFPLCRHDGRDKAEKERWERAMTSSDWGFTGPHWGGLASVLPNISFVTWLIPKLSDSVAAERVHLIEHD